MVEKQSHIVPNKEPLLARGESLMASPFRALERFASEMDRMFADFGFRARRARPDVLLEDASWTPRIDVTQRNNELIIRADLPGLTKDDIKVDAANDAITIQGERHREHDEEHGGIYRTERSYGAFFRAIPLPEGAIADQAKASFKDGVLEITMPAPPEHVNSGRRLEIANAPDAKK